MSPVRSLRGVEILNKYTFYILMATAATAAATAATETSTSTHPPVLTPRDEISHSAINLTSISWCVRRTK